MKRNHKTMKRNHKTMKRNHKTKKRNHKTKKRNHKTKKCNHKTIKKKHHFYAVGSGRMKTEKRTSRSPKQTPSPYAKPKCPYDDSEDGCYNYNSVHRNRWFHTYTPPSPRDIITEWIKSTQSKKDDMNLNQLIFGRKINYTPTNQSKIFKRFLRYIAINIKQYTDDEIKEINLLLHRLDEDSNDYSIEVNKDKDNDFYEALTQLGFSGKDDDSNVIQLHGYSLYHMIKDKYFPPPDPPSPFEEMIN